MQEGLRILHEERELQAEIVRKIDEQVILYKN